MDIQLFVFYDRITEVENGDLVVLNVQRNLPLKEDVDLKDLFDEIESVAGMTENTLLLRTIEEHEAFSMVFVKGSLIVLHSVSALSFRPTR